MRRDTRVQRTGPRLLRWWMVVLCLLVSWLCWWGVNKWLEPKPLWTRPRPAGGWISPIVEDPEGKQLLVAVYPDVQTVEDNSMITLELVDSRTGATLRNIKAKEGNFGSLDDKESTPRFRNHALWRLSNQFENDISRHSLHCWDYAQGQGEKVVHTWHSHPLLRTNFTWPAKSSIILMRSQMTLDALTLEPYANPFKNLFLNVIAQQAWLVLPTWYETWKVSEETGKPPQLLARWSTDASHWSQSPDFSENGQWAAFTEDYPDGRLCIARAKATGKNSSQGEELFNLFRIGVPGIQVHDTRTGKLVHHFVDQSAPVRVEFLHNDLLLTYSHAPKPGQTLTLSELETEAARPNEDLFSNHFPRTRHLYRMTATGLHELACPEEITSEVIYLIREGDALIGWKRTDETSTNYHVHLDDTSLKLEHSYELPSENVYGDRRLGRSNQVLYLRSPMDLLWFHKWRKQWDWLDWTLEKIRPLLPTHNHVVVADSQAMSSTRHVFVKDLCDDALETFTKLYLTDYEQANGEEIRTNLNAYAIPLQLYSRWWGRAAACVPVALLLIYLTRRKRA